MVNFRPTTSVQFSPVVDSLEPLEKYVNARARWRCRCNGCGRIVTPTLWSIRTGSCGCRHCGNKAVGIRRMAAGEEQAFIDMHNAGLEPLDPHPGAIAPWSSQCVTCNEIVSPTLNSIRTGLSSGCRHCGRAVMGGRRISAGADQAVADMQAAGLEPMQPYPGATRPWQCRCTRCDYDVSARLHDIRAGQSGCAPCGYAAWAASRIAVGQAQAMADMRNAGLEPLDPYPGARHPWRSKCTRCNNIVTPSLGSIRYLGTGCRYCAPFGIDLTAPTLVYVLHHRGAKAVKVGITGLGTKSDRLRSFERDGWDVFRIARFDTGIEALAVEQRVLRWVRDSLGFPSFLTADQMPRGGASETVSAIALPAPALWEIVCHEITDPEINQPSL